MSEARSSEVALEAEEIVSEAGEEKGFCTGANGV